MADARLSALLVVRRMLHEAKRQRAGSIRALTVLECAAATFTATCVARIGSLIIVTIYPGTLL